MSSKILLDQGSGFPMNPFLSQCVNFNCKITIGLMWLCPWKQNVGPSLLMFQQLGSQSISSDPSAKHSSLFYETCHWFHTLFWYMLPISLKALKVWFPHLLFFFFHSQISSLFLFTLYFAHYFSSQMRAPEQPYPSFTLVLLQQSYSMCLPPYSVSQNGHYQPKSGWMLNLEDLLMVSCCTTCLLAFITWFWHLFQWTVDTHYDSLLVHGSSCQLWHSSFIVYDTTGRIFRHSDQFRGHYFSQREWRWDVVS